MGDELDYIFILRALRDIPFGVGKKLLISFLQGKNNHESITKNQLDKLESFGCLAYDTDELDSLINNLVLNKLIKQVSLNQNKFWKVMELSGEGSKEIDNPQLYKKKIAYNLRTKTTQITEQDKQQFNAFGEFLSKYNDEQKKAIISNKNHVLCIAGAGSGKTTVLTKKIEFLIKYKSVDPRKILAITFTRKARQEMQHRLENFDNLTIETFNSFCEKILKTHNDMIYDQQVDMISYRDKILITRKALSNLGTNMGRAISTYFSYGQKRGKTQDQLANIFMNDCFFIRDYLKSRNQSSNDFDTNDPAAELVFGVGNYIDAYMKRNGKRDFTDQLIDAIKLFKEKKELIPKYDYILIDEYQDINDAQINLIDLLNPFFLFCVGDPRQSIFGWRGSSIKYILDFEEKYKGAETITLTRNYRSNKHIVDLINKSIKDMGLLDLKSTIDQEKDMHLLTFASEDHEFSFIIQKIKKSKLPREEIFVLARTNRQLTELSKQLKRRGISHVVKSDEINRGIIAKEGEITLATIHAIKGLEAEMVFVMGCTSLNFPCRGSEHPVIDMIKVNEYDKEEEEKRLFYVAMSRAKNHLILTYPGKKHTHFITKEMLKLFGKEKVQMEIETQDYSKEKFTGDLNDRLRNWRRNTCSKMNLPPYMVMHDKTLIELAQKRPTTKQELETIHGMGPARIMKYGDELIDLINFS
jgi:superfamily I DNA/RNA helicase|tara:strand:- start:1593 stop:3683 length:2091 start_codon:yes stop_codon:yes gene_type:complete